MSKSAAGFMTANFREPGAGEEWDHFVTVSANGGLLHTRRFLDYHQDRFLDISLMFRDRDGGGLIGVMPIALNSDGGRAAVSHAGSSFGGLVTQRPDPMATAGMLLMAARLLREIGLDTLTVLTHPTIFHRQPDDTQQLFLALAGRVVQHHLWSVMQLGHPVLIGKKRLATAKRAQLGGVVVRESDAPGDYRRFYDTLAYNLEERHQVKPVHSFDEVMDLRARLGSSARLFMATSADLDLLAATWIWDYGNGVWHSQYICSTAEGRRRDAVDALILSCQQAAKEAGQRIYSLGRNTRPDGWQVDAGLLAFKKRLGFGLAEQRRIDVDLAQLHRVCRAWSEGESPLVGAGWGGNAV